MTDLSGLDSIRSFKGSEGVTTQSRSSGNGLQAQVAAVPEGQNRNGQNPDELNALKDALNKVAEMAYHQLKFKISDENETAILIVVDARSGEVIRQIPEEDAITLKQMMAEGLAAMREKTGLLLETDI